MCICVFGAHILHELFALLTSLESILQNVERLVNVMAEIMLATFHSGVSELAFACSWKWYYTVHLLLNRDCNILQKVLFWLPVKFYLIL